MEALTIEATHRESTSWGTIEMNKLKELNLIVVLAVNLPLLWNELVQTAWPGGVC